MWLTEDFTDLCIYTYTYNVYPPTAHAQPPTFRTIPYIMQRHGVGKEKTKLP